MLYDPMEQWVFKEAASRTARKRRRLRSRSRVQSGVMSDKENCSPSMARRTSLHSFARSDSSVSSSVDSDAMLQPTDTSSISTNTSNEEVPTTAAVGPIDKTARWRQMRKKAGELWTDFYDAISETNEQLAEQQSDEVEKLNPLVMQSAISKCLSESHVYLEALAGVYDFLIWKNPVASLCAYCIIVYCIYKEIFMTVFLGLILLQLGLNHLECVHNINVGLRFLPRRELPRLKFEISGLQLIFEVARRAQVILGFCANVLQKLRMLFMWKDPTVTLHFVFFISFFFTVSLFSINTYIIVVGFLIANKCFIMTYMYHRFPQTRRMFDVAYYFYRSTPIESKKQQVQAQNVAHPPVTKKRTFPLGGLFKKPATVRRDTMPLLDLPEKSTQKRKK